MHDAQNSEPPVTGPRGAEPVPAAPAARPPDKTRKSLVDLCRSGDAKESAAAVGKLYLFCRAPLYAYLRHLGESEHDAQDILDGFMGVFLSGEGFRQFTYEKHTSLRAWLKTCVKNYRLQEYAKSTAQKRGGGLGVYSDGELEAGYLHAADPGLTPDEMFDRKFFTELLDRVRAECAADFSVRHARFLATHRVDAGELHAAIMAHLTRDSEASRAEVEQRLGLPADSFKHRVAEEKKTLSTRVRTAICDVTPKEEVTAELNAVVRLLAR